MNYLPDVLLAGFQEEKWCRSHSWDLLESGGCGARRSSPGQQGSSVPSLCSVQFTWTFMFPIAVLLKPWRGFFLSPCAPLCSLSSSPVSVAQVPVWAGVHRSSTHCWDAPAKAAGAEPLRALCKHPFTPRWIRRERRLIISSFFLFNDQNIYSSMSGAGSSPKTLFLIVNVTFNIDDVGYSSHTWMSY